MGLFDTKYEIDEGTGMPVLPEGYEWEVTLDKDGPYVYKATVDLPNGETKKVILPRVSINKVKRGFFGNKTKKHMYGLSVTKDVGFRTYETPLTPESILATAHQVLYMWNTQLAKKENDRDASWKYAEQSDLSLLGTYPPKRL